MAEPQEIKVETDSNKFTLKGRPCELSSFSFIPTERDDPPERTVFNTPKQLVIKQREKERYPRSTYERLFRKEYGYNNKLHRDDREHAKSRGLIVNEEEKLKEVPTLSSSEYGHRLELFVDNPDRQHVRIAHVRAEFFRRNGITS
ncbi:cilia- and flagella-associated protein 90-like isoform X1 [Saccostrea echinata]|uniref:cilia- and flagella-associated protein 90-like isoform X1 n=1 Tax=Saccostrea echinata TaxID=191078 RepID=UPI002A821A36|nr:cilia- and flagella-associated protein 90-like isoform X1 [Saccostrea echinata]